MLSCGAAAELKVMKAQTNNYQTKPSPIPIRGDKTSESVGQKSLPNKEGKPVGRRLSEPVQPTTSSVVYKTRKSVRKDVFVLCSISIRLVSLPGNNTNFHLSLAHIRHIHSQVLF